MQIKRQLRTARSIRTLSEGSSIYTGQLDEQASSKFYRFRLNRATHLNLGLTDLRSNADLALLNRRGKVIEQSARGGRLSETIDQSLNQGIYYIRVSGRKQTRYRLSFTIDDPERLASPPQLDDAIRLMDDPIIKEVVAITNAYRQQAGLQPLRLNPKLTAAAQAHSEDMALNDFFAHTGSNQSSVFDRVDQTGYDYKLVTENIAAGYTTAATVVKEWMNSPSHRANIMYPDMQEIGVGVYFLANDTGKTNYRYYWTQDFGIAA